MSRKMPAHLKRAARSALNLLLIILAVLFFIYLRTAVHFVENNEVGIHQRFGKIINPNMEPGAYLTFPWPIDRVNKVPKPKVESYHLKDFSQSFLFDSKSNISFTTLTGLGTYLITGDNNLVNLECMLQYEVIDPVAYFFNLGENIFDPKVSDRKDGLTLENRVASNVQRFLIEMACNTCLHCIAKMNVDKALTNWDPIVTQVKLGLQERLNAIESGLAVTFVEIKVLKPPAQVQEFFDDVINAKIDKDNAINAAESYRNEEIPAALSRAERLRTEAEGYKSEVVQTARGEADRFLKQLSEYEKDPALTRYRFHMNALQEVLLNVEKYYVVDTSNGRKPAEIKLFK